MEFKKFDAVSLPPQEQIDETHANMLHDFIKQMNGLRSMVLIGVREADSRTDAVEFACRATTADLFRASATILEAIVDRTPEHERERDEIILLKKVIKTIYTIAGDNENEIIRLTSDDKPVIN